jgi:hypothetical protein
MSVTPIVDPPAAPDPPEEAVAWSSPPQPATTSAASASAATAMSSVMGVVRVMWASLGATVLALGYTARRRLAAKARTVRLLTLGSCGSERL